MIRNNNRFEDGAIYLIYAICDPYNAKSHHHGEEVLKSDGATPVKWVYDNNFGHLYTREEAHKELHKLAAEKLINTAIRWESKEEIEAFIKSEELEGEDASWFKGAGWYENTEVVFLDNSDSLSYDTMTWGIGEAEGRWAVRDYEAGKVLYAENQTYKDAQEVVKRYEAEDRANGCHDKYFYEIVWIKEKED